MGAKTHWTENDFIQHLYGAASVDEGHLETCSHCRLEMDRIRAVRSAATAEPEVSTDFLAAQRRAIYGRLGTRSFSLSRWMPAFAAALMLLVGLLVFLPGQKQSVKSDDAVFAEVYSLEQTSEPQASKVMHALFEDE
jgi:anti-sigma factor RsiW